jgi:hypothetical protein
VNYKVVVAEWVAEFVRDLPREVCVQVLQRLLVDLPADPDRELGAKVFPFAHKYTFSVTAKDDSQQPSTRRWFVFVVDRGTPGELHVESVRDANDPEPN